jgi:hypothetical protein
MMIEQHTKEGAMQEISYTFSAKIMGKPELEAIYREHLAAKARKAEILGSIGWPNAMVCGSACGRGASVQRLKEVGL